MRSSCAWESSSAIVSSGQISSRTNSRIQSSFSWNSGSVENSHAMLKPPLARGAGRPLWGERRRPGAVTRVDVTMAQQHLDRLTAIDASFLHQEGPSSHMHVGALARLDGPPPPFDALLDSLRMRL